MKHILIATLFFIFPGKAVSQNSQTFNYTGFIQFFIVPSLVDSVTVDVRGAEGAKDGGNLGIPGKGGRVQASIPVTSGDTLFLSVGGSGLAPQGGYNGGGEGGTTNTGPAGGGGGGASDIRQGGNAVTNRIIVAGGGGGCGGYTGVNGGNGGGLTGYAGDNGAATGGAPGSQLAPGNGGTGAGNCGFPGTQGVNNAGGDGGDVTCGNGFGGGGGGGGGYFAGGGGGSAAYLVCCPDWSGGGGGGSSYTEPSASGVIHTPGFQTGNGLVMISWNVNTGISENGFHHFEIDITPNPFKDIALVKFENYNNALIHICMKDLSGRLIIQNKTTNSHFVLNTPEIEPGIYLIEVQNENTLRTKTVRVFKY